ncbi:MAG: hypothetical protein M0Z79_07355 [Nitrospiraceae bacterium]|nr:hypothetical protein [Nitrospiraceae bacterium]
MTYQTKTVLVTVKAYPNPSTKYRETVCVAGIDIDTGRWIRLYPIPFRDLDDKNKFTKYSIIEVRALKSPADNRPESFKVVSSSISVLDRLDTRNNWDRRKCYLLPTISSSLCDILRENATNDKSLGMFKPAKVAFRCNKVKPKKTPEKRDACYAQFGLYAKNPDPIEAIPYDFRYNFYCHGEPECPGHDLPIIDWELMQSYRKWRYQYSTEDILLEEIKKRWLDNMCSDSHDTFFFVGNMQRFKENFMVLGVFYPKKATG